jgi:predicted RNA binding protein YcfA (HicA-like mRNA interferase family)
VNQRLPHKEARETNRLLARHGWQLERIGAHLIYRHQTGALLVVAGTPSCRGARARVLCEARRVLRAWEEGRA